MSTLITCENLYVVGELLLNFRRSKKSCGGKTANSYFAWVYYINIMLIKFHITSDSFTADTVAQYLHRPSCTVLPESHKKTAPRSLRLLSFCHLLLLTRLDKSKVALFVLLYQAGSSLASCIQHTLQWNQMSFCQRHNFQVDKVPPEDGGMDRWQAEFVTNSQFDVTGPRRLGKLKRSLCRYLLCLAQL